MNLQIGLWCQILPFQVIPLLMQIIDIFSIFPFFWGVGAIWDVLVNSEAGNQIKNETSFIIAILMFIAMIGISIFIHDKIKNRK